MVKPPVDSAGLLGGGEWLSSIACNRGRDPSVKSCGQKIGLGRGSKDLELKWTMGWPNQLRSKPRIEVGFAIIRNQNG